MLPVNINFEIIPGNAGGFRVNTLDEVGAALDVSAGFTVAKLNFAPANDANPSKASQDLKANISSAFDATGVDISFTGAEASTIAAALYTGSSAVALLLSNDAGTTASLAASGNATLRPGKELV